MERANGYLETSFLPGRTFEDTDDFNRQLTVWLKRTNQRIHGTTKIRPSEAIFEDRAGMMGLPPVPPDPAWRFTTPLPRDHYVRVDTNAYSVHPRLVGRADVEVTLNDVVVMCDTTEVARHKRCLAKHPTILAPDHARIAVSSAGSQHPVAAVMGSADGHLPAFRVGNLGRKWAGDGQQEHIGGRQCGQLLGPSDTRCEAGDDDREFTPGDQGETGSALAGRSDSLAMCCPPACRDLRGCGHGSQGDNGTETPGISPGSVERPKKRKKTAAEQVAKW